MNHDLDMEKIILNNFGVAPQLENRSIAILFNDNKMPNTVIKDHHCTDGDVRFSLVDIDKDEMILSMDFYKINNFRAFSDEGTYRLDLIYIHDPSLRRIGIGKFYINKLKEYMLENGGKKIALIANPNIEIFKNDLGPRVTIQELVKYYESFGDENIKIEVLS